jgi:phosphate starvation-inducible protein PhoH and related proteins
MARRKVAKEKEVPFELLADFERSIKFNKRNFRFTPKQKKFLDLILEEDSKIIFVSGPAGSSKTYMSLYGMLKLLEEDFSKDILYVRSIAESADTGLGSLPGDIADKFDPFLCPLYDKMEEIVASGDAIYLKQREKVSAVPINFLRGASWQNKLVFADEAQNFTLKELTTLITRIGEDSKIIIGGDFFQSDIRGKSGFGPMFDKFDDDESKEMGIHTFSFNESDIVRSKILKFIIKKLEGEK